MTRTFTACAAAALALVLASPAGADAGRYVLKEIDGGFIRLDTETGAVSHCRSRDEQWRCELVADAQAALQDEIARLTEENAALEQRLAELTGPRGERSTGPQLQLPSEEDFDRIFGMFEKFMRRFIDFARSLNEDTGREDTGRET
jgi:hypothetical protein